MAKFPELAKKSFISKLITVLLLGFGLGAYTPLAPMVTEVGCAVVEAAGGGDCE